MSASQSDTVRTPSEHTLIENAADLLDLVMRHGEDLTETEQANLLAKANVHATLAVHAALDRMTMLLQRNVDAPPA